jgi:hypothetical protein
MAACTSLAVATPGSGGIPAAADARDDVGVEAGAAR